MIIFIVEDMQKDTVWIYLLGKIDIIVVGDSQKENNYYRYKDGDIRGRESGAEGRRGRRGRERGRKRKRERGEGGREEKGEKGGRERDGLRETEVERGEGESEGERVRGRDRWEKRERGVNSLVYNDCSPLY